MLERHINEGVRVTAATGWIVLSRQNGSASASDISRCRLDPCWRMYWLGSPQPTSSAAFQPGQRTGGQFGSRSPRGCACRHRRNRRASGTRTLTCGEGGWPRISAVRRRVRHCSRAAGRVGQAAFGKLHSGAVQAVTVDRVGSVGAGRSIRLAGVTGGKAAPGQQVRRAYGEGSVHTVRLCVVQVAEQAAARRVGMARVGGMGGGLMNRFGPAHVAARVDENDVRPPRRRGFGQAGKDGRSDWRSTRG